MYALDKKNKKHIELTKFPFIQVREDGRHNAADGYESTNGAYRNGLRMQTQETVEIESGDEIRFGNLNYCYP